MKKIVVLLSVFFIFSCAKKEIVIENIPFEFGENNAEPNLVANHGELTLSWVSSVRGKEATLYYSQFSKSRWNQPKSIASGTDWFVNWADFPANAINGDVLLTSYLKKSATGTYTYDVVLNLQKLNGEFIKKDFLLNTDGKKAEHGFVSMVSNSKGGFYVTWLDGRNTVEKNNKGHHKPMTIRFAEITKSGEIVNESELDGSTCDCCQTSITNTKNGPVVVYRDRSDAEIRDIYITRNTNGHWSTPKAVHNDNWKINGCPVNGPKVVSNENDLAVAWFTAADNTPTVNVVFSSNLGESFNNPIKVNDLETIGRVDVAYVNKNEVLVSYMEVNNEETYLKCKKVHKNGNVSEAITISKIDGSRSTGVPQLEVFNNEVFVVWTTTIDEKQQLKSVKFNL